ncbi:MAG: VOC family protein [Rhodobacteraceae bacterium]|nr:VOC family protein [Paracoccaceae bacterium]
MILDHLAVAATTLEEARALIGAALGVALQPGGKHTHFGTHNHLLGLADGLYLEAIAIDPDAPKPNFPRWFDLDAFTGPARLSNWICRVDDLDLALSNRSGAVGTRVDLSRGDLRWGMGVPQSGRLPYDNMHPALIQWQGAYHPATKLAQSGCTLRRLVVAHPFALTLQDELAIVDPRVVFEPGSPALMAEFDTPHGPRTLQ